MPKFDFDAVVDRRAVPALKTHPAVLGADGAALFAAGVADMDFAVAPAIQRAMTERVSHAVFGYEAVPDGLLPALRAWFRVRHKWEIDTDHILRAPNVLNILAMSANLFTAPGDGIIVQPPAFFDFADIIRENNRRVVENPLILKDGHYEMDFEGLKALVSDPRTTMLFLCNPHNPVGRVWRREELARMGEICRAHGVLVVSDEIHSDITFAGHPYTPFASLSPADAENSISCISPAKSFNIASCCSAFSVISSEHRRRVFQAENSRLTVNKNNAFASVAMEAAWREGGPWLDAALEYIAGNAALLEARLAACSEVKVIRPEGTFLVWLDFRALSLTPEALTDFLRQEAGWAITRGIAFGTTGAGFGRLNVACRRAALTAALDQLEAALLRHRGKGRP